MNIRELEIPRTLQEHFTNMGGEVQGLFLVNACLQVIVGMEGGRQHLSVSHPRRYPTWDEIRDVRYALLPNEKTFAILFPPPEEYVNFHKNCFHLYEWPEAKEESRIIIATK